MSRRVFQIVLGSITLATIGYTNAFAAGFFDQITEIADKDLNNFDNPQDFKNHSLQTGRSTKGENLSTIANSLQPFSKTITSIEPECLGSHIVIDWLNTINIGSFFDKSTSFIRRHSDCFVFLEGSHDLNFWIEPYGFYAHYRSASKGNEKLDFTQASYGVSIGTDYAMTEEIHLGGAIGYFYSSLSCGKEAHANGVYLGPCIEYLFTDGSVGLTLFGVGNFYQGSNEVEFSNKTSKTASYDVQSWDVNVRLEADYTLEPPADFFIPDLNFQPFARIDYLNVFEQAYREKVGDGVSVHLSGRHASFFYSKIGVQCEKAMICNSSINVSSYLRLGWINMTPLSTAPLKWKEAKDKKERSTDIDPESKNQADLGIGISGVHKSGLLATLEYEAAIGAGSPMQTGRVRLEWNW